MSNHVKDMTSGKPTKLILSFAIPLMIGNVFQQLYIIVDTMVVGQFVGVEALASLGAAEWIQWLVLGIVMGATQGFSILIAQRFGAEDKDGLHKAMTMSILISGVIAVVSTVVSIICIRGILMLLKTPANVIEDSVTYLTIIFSGIVVVTGYNIMASILRALGNSKTPLVAMIIAAFINVGLDLLFVIVFKWGVAGAAAATVIAQVFSCLFCLWVINRMPILKTTKHDWRLDWGVIKRLVLLSTPMVFQNVIISIGGMTVQYVVNGFGFLFVAGFTATNKLYGVLEVAATSFGFSMATYTGQNLGAKKYDRIRSGMRSAQRMAVITAVIISVAMLIFGKSVLKMFISGDVATVEAVADIGYKYLAIMSVFLFVLYLLHVYRSALQGMGNTVIPMISGMVEMAMRTGVALLLPIAIGATGIYFAEVAAWVGAAILLVVAYFVKLKRLERTKVTETLKSQ